MNSDTSQMISDVTQQPTLTLLVLFVGGERPGRQAGSRKHNVIRESEREREV